MTTINHSARVGVITDQTGALSFMFWWLRTGSHFA